MQITLTQHVSLSQPTKYTCRLGRKVDWVANKEVLWLVRTIEQMFVQLHPIIGGTTSGQHLIY